MQVNGVGSDLSMPAMMCGQLDDVSRNLQNQIRIKQQELRQLSEKKDLNPEEIAKKQQEIKKEIAELNSQLRQHQMQNRSKQNNGTSIEDMLGTANQNKASDSDKGSGLSVSSMEAMAAADASMKQSEVQDSIGTKMKGRTRILKEEIRLDKVRGVSTEDKEAELAETEEKVNKAVASSVGMAKKAGDTIKEANEKEDKEDKKGDKEDEEDVLNKTSEKTENGYPSVDVYL